MDLEKLLSLLGVDKLDESQQSEVKEKLEVIIESKVSEKVSQQVEEKLDEEKESLIESYEEKFEDYKKDITSKFSNFVDTVLEEEMSIPEKVMEYARKGELYSDLVDQFKIRLAVDEGMLDEEVRSLLRESKSEILGLRESLDEKEGENLELKQDAQEMAANLYLREKCDGLTESQKRHVLDILGDLTERDEIDRKFKLVLESLGLVEEDDEEEDDDDKDKKKKKKDDDEEDDDDDDDVSEKKKIKGKYVDDDEDDDLDEEKKGKGKSEVEDDEEDDDEDEDDENVDESKSPWKVRKNSWLSILNEGRLPTKE